MPATSSTLSSEPTLDQSTDQSLLGSIDGTPPQGAGVQADFAPAGQAPAPMPPLVSPSMVLVTPHLQCLLPPSSTPPRRRYSISEELGAIIVEWIVPTYSNWPPPQISKVRFQVARFLGNDPRGHFQTSTPLTGVAAELALLSPGSVIVPGHLYSSTQVQGACSWCTPDVTLHLTEHALRCTSEVSTRNAAVAALTIATLSGYFDSFSPPVREVS